jgi:hypothetical protein
MQIENIADSNHQLIYLDIGFITDFYEATQNSEVPTTISRTKGGSGGINANFFGIGANVSGEVSETREFTVSTTSMYKQLHEKLLQYSTLEKRPNNNSQLFWLNGILRVRTVVSHTRQNNQIIHTSEGRYFYITSDIIDTVLLTSTHYFVFNYSPIIEQLPAMQDDFAIEVRCLLKLISENSNYKENGGRKEGEFLGTPLVILEKPTQFS